MCYAEKGDIMNVKNFVMTYYKNAADGFHIQRVENFTEAKKLHTHEFFQIYYIKKGSITHYLEGAVSRLVAGDMFIIPPGARHRIAVEDGAKFYSFSFMRSSMGDPCIVNGFVLDFLHKLESDAHIRAKVSLPADEVLKIENIMDSIYKEFENKRLACADAVRAYAIILLTNFARMYYKEEKSISYIEDSRQFILYCVEYIENNFFQNINLDSIVKLSAMSKTKFCSVFLEITGYTFNRYLNMCRIRKAIEYIKKGYKITAIYGLCGYNDFSTFYRNFKLVTGVPPSKFERQN